MNKKDFLESLHIREGISFSSQIYHFLAYLIKRQKMQLERSMFIVSVDIDVGVKQLGVINRGKNDVNIGRYVSEYRRGEIEEDALPLFVETFNDFELPVTFAIRGQLAEVDDSILDLLLESSVKHDIGAHGYYHRMFTNISRKEAENELKLISVGMKKWGVSPKSFIFPKNRAAHLKLLEKYGYKCYRSRGGVVNDCMYIEKHGRLYDVHPSFCLVRTVSSIFLRKIVDVAIAKKLPFHMWFHLWDFGETNESIQKNINKILFPLLDYAKKKEKEGKLTFETMLSATEEIEKLNL